MEDTDYFKKFGAKKSTIYEIAKFLKSYEKYFGDFTEE